MLRQGLPNRNGRALIEEYAHLRGGQGTSCGVLEDDANLFGADVRKPFDELAGGGAILAVLEQGRNGNAGTLEHPGATDALRMSLNRWARGPIDHTCIPAPPPNMPGRNTQHLGSGGADAYDRRMARRRDPDRLRPGRSRGRAFRGPIASKNYPPPCPGKEEQRHDRPNDRVIDPLQGAQHRPRRTGYVGRGVRALAAVGLGAIVYVRLVAFVAHGPAGYRDSSILRDPSLWLVTAILVAGFVDFAGRFAPGLFVSGSARGHTTAVVGLHLLDKWEWQRLDRRAARERHER